MREQLCVETADCFGEVGGPERGILTLGFGPEKYRRMAMALALSVRRVNPDLPIAVVTDHLDDPGLNECFDQLIPLDTSFGSGLQQKLNLDRYTPFTETLFIDADCLVVRDLEPVFDLMGIVPFGVVGFPVIDGKYWVEVKELMERFDLPYVGRFNAGIICFHGPDGRKVFEQARDLVADGMEGVPNYRGALVDEVPLAVALSRLGQMPIFDNGDVMRAPEPLESRFVVDVLNGVGRFKTKDKWVSPAILHFAYLYHGKGLRSAVYDREVKRLLGEGVSPRDHMRYAAAQAVFTLEGSAAIRTVWKAQRGAIRKALGRSAAAA